MFVTQNILINKSGQLKLADFGLARSYDSNTRGLLSPQVVTLWYRAPELLLGSNAYSSSRGSADYGAIDMWSVGATFGEMLIRKPMFDGNCEIGQIHTIFKGLGTPSEASWPGVSELPNFSVKFPKWPVRTAVEYLELKARGGPPRSTDNAAAAGSPVSHLARPALSLTLARSPLVICADGLDLLEKLLQYAPNKRVSAEQALAHPYFCRYSTRVGK